MSDKYEIRIEGHLNPRWSEWLGGMQITNLECGETLLTGLDSDQEALQDLLMKLRDLNLKLISVIKQSDPPGTPSS